MGSRRSNPSPLDSGRTAYSKWGDGRDVPRLDEIRKQLIKQNCDIRKLVFFVRLRDGRLIFLEEGNKRSGLTHIQGSHGDDFVRAFGEKARSLTTFLYEAITSWKLIGSYEDTKRGKYSLINFYRSDGEHVIKLVIANNGYIVSAFPIDYERAIGELKGD